MKIGCAADEKYEYFFAAVKSNYRWRIRPSAASLPCQWITVESRGRLSIGKRGLIMKWKASVAIALLIGFISVARASEPVKVDIEILSALIGPTKVNGSPWDAKFGFGGVATGAAGIISDMVAPGSGVLASKVVSAVTSAAPKGSASPDVIGYVVQKGTTTRALAPYAGTPLALATRHQKTQDSYTPRFNTSYSSWPIFANTRFQIHLWDADINNDDSIAVVELNREMIIDALDEGPVWVNVAEQSMNQLLYVQISVSKSHRYSSPKMNGVQW